MILALIAGCSESSSPTSQEETSTYADEQLLQKSGNDGGLGFIFASLSDAGVVDGVHHQIFMTGSGNFDHKRVKGGGFFNHADAASSPPPIALLATGKWRAKRLIRFTKTVAVESQTNPSGFNTSGILEIEVRLFPKGGPQKGIKATLKIICNIPSEGLFTGLHEGYFLNVEGGFSFEPATFPGGFPIGVTAFTPR